MRAFLLKLLIFASLVTGGFAVLLQWHPREEDNLFAKAIVDKEARLRATPPPRLLLVGGSNLALGVNSAALERALGRPTLNLAISGGFGREFILNQAAAHARPGDRIVLSLAYYVFTDAPPSAWLLSPALKAEPRVWRYFGVRQWQALLDGELASLAYLARTSLAHARGYYTPVHGLYRRDAFTPQGDLVAHFGQPSKPLGARKLPLRDSALHASLADIAAFVAHCQAQGATVYYDLTPWPESWVQANPEFVQRVYTGLRGVPGLMVLNTPADISFPVDLFYDSENHLGQSGVALRTQRLIQALSTAQPQ